MAGMIPKASARSVYSETKTYPIGVRPGARPSGRADRRRLRAPAVSWSLGGARVMSVHLVSVDLSLVLDGLLPCREQVDDRLASGHSWGHRLGPDRFLAEDAVSPPVPHLGCCGHDGLQRCGEVLAGFLLRDPLVSSRCVSRVSGRERDLVLVGRGDPLRELLGRLQVLGVAGDEPGSAADVAGDGLVLTLPGERSCHAQLTGGDVERLRVV